MTDPSLRASDEDRRHIVAALERHTAAGRLSLDEFSDRVGRVYVATTRGELAAVTRDLPVEPVSGQPRQLLLAFLIAAIAVVVLGIVLSVAR